MWRRAWVNGVDELWSFVEPMRVMQNQGIGLLIQGTREWSDYLVSADVTPHLARFAGIAARVQGMRRFYGLVLAQPNRLQLICMQGQLSVLAECDFPWSFGETYQLSLECVGNTISGRVGDTSLMAVDATLTCGAMALVICEGRSATEEVTVAPASGSETPQGS